ncbi:energy transducer TonB [Parasphingopyxis marina]|uniref:Energy transducer TonB n=1 Tax=Parasphingopyxis marina TaxID=2761622 RepID=A0A842I1B2_9SPHN|nr:energy transducer TonB [Parasphingopyxis marina]MBC2777554.1 energy transducer TonB [Parasphingopyxis marina]
MIWSTASRAADDPLRLPAAGPWEINYAEDNCNLGRRFGEGDQEISMVMSRFSPSDRFRLILTGPGLLRLHTRGEATIQFGPVEEEQEIEFLTGQSRGSKTMFVVGQPRIAPWSEEEQALLERSPGGDPQFVDIQPIGFERLGAVEYLLFDAPGLPAIQLETGSLREPFEAFDRCMDELLTHWGIDVERHRSLTRPATPVGSVGRWIVTSDYPRAMIRGRNQGIVYFRLNVGLSGEVTACHIQQSTRPEGFEDAVCRALQRRARFDPALDADGNPVASYYVNSVSFQMP